MKFEINDEDTLVIGESPSYNYFFDTPMQAYSDNEADIQNKQKQELSDQLKTQHDQDLEAYRHERFDELIQ